MKVNEIKTEGNERMKPNYKKRTQRLLRQISALEARQYERGDYAATEALCDLANAIALANLTKRQAEALRLVYVEDMAQEAAGERMGIGQFTVSELASTAVGAIAEVYEAWDWRAKAEGASE